MAGTDEKIAQLEAENRSLQERLAMLEKMRTPLTQLPTPQPSPVQPCRNPCCAQGFTAPSEIGSTESASTVLHYLKTVLGFSIRQHGNKLILRSVYSFCEEDTFEVEVVNSKLVLRQTDYLNEWQEYINTYIKGGKSYSAFFAAVTLDLFNKRTFG